MSVLFVLSCDGYLVQSTPSWFVAAVTKSGARSSSFYHHNEVVIFQNRPREPSITTSPSNCPKETVFKARTLQSVVSVYSDSSFLRLNEKPLGVVSQGKELLSRG